MRTSIRPALASLAFFSVVTGVAYPLLVTGISAAAFPAQASGSLIMHGDSVNGSALIGQAFAQPGHLWGRPSAIALPYDARGSSGSNLGPSNPLLDSLVRSRVAALRAADPSQTAPVPVELVTASGSGLDPHLSPAAAVYQAGRIARTRGLDPAVVTSLIDAHVEPRTFGILGEPRVNVLRVNLALDSLSTSSQPTRP